ncbi:MAG: peptide ABC transporter substrate-binding protein [Planctomycetes bacterium]|nr:peptide ABC transporter substrate-binding protein [Planctomycetota bacterium]
MSARTVRRSLAFLLLAGLFAGALAIASGARIEEADFTFSNGTEVSTLDPATVTGVPEGRVIRAIFEGLVVKHPQTLAPLPGMAESWEISPDGLTYTFHIRKNAVWTNGDPCTAHDFDYSFRRMLDPETGAEYSYQLDYLRGAKAYRTDIDPETRRPRRSWDTVGVRVADDHTLLLALEEPTHYFMALAGFYPLFPVNRRNIEEAKRDFPDTWQLEWLRPENIVTNGPYRVAARRVNDRIRLVKNPDYWDAENVAFDTIDVLAIENWSTQLNVYLTGGCHWIDQVPPLQVPNLLPREDFNPEPYFGSYFYRINVTRPPLDDVRVRKALALSIDRRAICEKVTKAGERPSYSLVPPGLPSYRNAEMEKEDLARARQLLADAGYGPGGAEFPSIEIHYNTSEKHRDVAEVIQNGWKRDLGIDVKLLNQEWKVYLDSQTNLQYDVSRSAWIGDYDDPNTFLDLFLTGGGNNKTGWGNPRYDRLIAEARKLFDPAERMKVLHDAERILMDELPIIPIYSYVTSDVVAPRLGGFHWNILDEHFPKFFYWMDDEELAAVRARQPADWVRVPFDAGPPEGQYAPARLRERRP